MEAEIYEPTDELRSRVERLAPRWNDEKADHDRWTAIKLANYSFSSPHGQIIMSDHAIERMHERGISHLMLELACRYGRKIQTHKFLLKYRDIPVAELNSITGAERDRLQRRLPVCIILEKPRHLHQKHYTMKTCYRLTDRPTDVRTGHENTYSEKNRRRKHERNVRDAISRAVLKMNRFLFRSDQSFIDFCRRIRYEAKVRGK